LFRNNHNNFSLHFEEPPFSQRFLWSCVVGIA
jgi:hypothetical protein